VSWKLVFVTYYDENSPADKDSKDGRPSIVFFAKDYPFKVGQEFPKLLTIHIDESPAEAFLKYACRPRTPSKP
jgi:hypothetical protein